MNEGMKEVKANLDFKGGVTKHNYDKAPAENGIYAAFACTKKGNVFHPRSVVYIGKAEGKDTIKKRISDHVNDRDEADSGKQSYWEENYLFDEEVVAYTWAEYGDDLHDIEALMIYENKPDANIYGKDNYLADADVVDVTCLGKKGKLQKNNYKKK